MVSIILWCRNDAEGLRRFCDSLQREIVALAVDVVLICNGHDAHTLSLGGVPVNVITANKYEKPSLVVAQAVTMARAPVMVCHTSRDEVLHGYGVALSQAVSLASGAIIRLSSQLDTPSMVFAHRLILSGYVFSRATLAQAPVDIMFLEDANRGGSSVVQTLAGEPVFRYHDIPFVSTEISTLTTLIVTIKNRLAHWRQTMPSLVAQQGAPYELLLVDYFSEDAFSTEVRAYIEKQKIYFSPWLRQLTVVRLQENKKFSSCKAKNLGARCAMSEAALLAFSDIDTFLREDYLAYWAGRVAAGGERCFAAGRAALDRRIATEVNYGNMVVPRALYEEVQGHNEQIVGYGGDDDEFMHRLHNAGARELNPHSPEEARQYSLLHGDEERLTYLEQPTKSGLQDWAFLQGKQARWCEEDIWGRQEHIKTTYSFPLPHTT